MILLDVATELKENYDYEEVPINDLVNVLRDGFTAVGKLLVKDGEDSVLQVPRFGSFKVKRRKARVGHNPQTKEKINIPEKIVLNFKASHILKTEFAAIKPKKAKKTKQKKKAKQK